MKREKLISEFRALVVPRVERIAELQDASGRVLSAHDEAERLLGELVVLLPAFFEMVGLTEMAVACVHDIADWIDRGVHEMPTFDETAAAFSAEYDGWGIFFGPVRLANGQYRLEAYMGTEAYPTMLREIEARIPICGKRFHSMRTIVGTKGFRSVACLAFSIADLQVSHDVEVQHAPIFFFHKFQSIYQLETIARVRTVFPACALKSAFVPDEQMFEVAVLSHYLREHFSSVGVRTSGERKRDLHNFYVQLLELLRVECHTILMANEVHLPHFEVMTECILFDRLLRYPAMKDALRNVESAAGYFLFSWLVRSGGAIARGDDYATIDMQICLNDLERLVYEIETLELIYEEEEYLDAIADFVHAYLPEGGEGDFYLLPSEYFIYALNQSVDVPRFRHEEWLEV
ncbi:MAG: hypothetical protein ACRC5C_08435 [Bacilli bacterium]